MGDDKPFDTGAMCGAQTERGYNQSTTSGLPFWVMDPRPEDIRILDIAHHLSRITRFGGALRADVWDYTVAQHSCLVSDNCPDGFKLEGLLHDAGEAYHGDLIKPIKMQVPDWKSMEHRVEAAIRAKFGLPPVISPEVKKEDWRAVATEHRDVQTPTTAVDWGTLAPAWPEPITPWTRERCFREFLERFTRLVQEGAACR